jgi:hypothetical protein
MRINVVTEGFLISGLLIGEQEYFSTLNERLLRGLGLGKGERPPLFQGIQEDTMEEVSARGESRADAPPRRFIHMRNVELRGAGESTITLSYLRIRLDRVSAYDFATRGE